MPPVVLSIIACFGWGIADFIGGYKAKQMPTLTVLLFSTLSGTLLMAGFIFSFQIPFPKDLQLWWAILAGPAGLAAMFLLYRSLAVGVMSVLAPVSASGVMIPVAWGLFRGETMSNPAFTGMFLAVTGCLLAVMEKKSQKTSVKLTRGVGLAVSSALMVGLYFIFMDNACTENPVWASFVMRGTTLACIFPILMLSRTSLRQDRPNLLILGVMGAFDILAAVCFAIATSRGMLSQTALISSLYPGVTVVLSAGILKEKISAVQTSGVVLSLAGIALISAF